MALIYRTARIDDLERAQVLVVSSINELTERHGFGPMASVRPPHFQAFSLRDDPDGLWIAEEAGQILGSAFGWVCDDFWFLAELFVSPDQQGRGIGNELLRRALAHAEKREAKTKALITFAFNRVSQALYIRHGMFPRTPVYFFNTSSAALRSHLPAEQSLRTSAIEASDVDSLDRIDREALGFSRAKHHRHLIGDSTLKGMRLHDGTDCIGYVYVSAGGHIGPMAVTRRNALGAGFATALRFAAKGGAAQVSAFIPGSAEAALSAAVHHGMRITFPMLLMSSRHIGDWARYLPRNPGFM
jgi:ribosomal protein S18 acetylase RimI-like enzyme